jgi:hypothetical protein
MARTKLTSVRGSPDGRSGGSRTPASAAKGSGSRARSNGSGLFVMDSSLFVFFCSPLSWPCQRKWLFRFLPVFDLSPAS